MPPAVDAEAVVRELEQALLSLDRVGAQRIIAGATGEGAGPSYMALEALIVPALEHIGQEWERGHVALAQVYMSGRLCEELVDAILPAGAFGRNAEPRMAIAVLEDHHLLGKRLVSAVLRATGYALEDYGSMEVDSLAGRVQDDEIEILLVSVLMLRSALRIKALRATLDTLGRPVTLLVGGAPFRFDEGLWREVGADGTAHSAAGAAALVARFAKELAR